MKVRICLAIASICGLSTFSHAGLVAWYKFDEGAGATVADNELPGSRGAIGSNVSTGIAGISGNSFRFTGGAAENSIVDMGNASFFPAINTSGQLTLSAWVSTTDDTDDRNTVIFAGSDKISNNYTDLGVNGLLGKATARNRPIKSSLPQQTGILSTGVKVNDGRWHNIVITIDLKISQLLLYVDGVLTNSQTMASSLFPKFNNFEVGRLGRAGVPAIGYSGLVDDVQVYDSVLTADEVKYIFDNPGSKVPESRR